MQRKIPLSFEPRNSRKGDLFLKGPVSWEWLKAAAWQRGKALHVGIVLWLLAGLRKTREVKVNLSGLKDLGVNRHAAYEGLAKLERAGLVSVIHRPGSKSKVRLLDLDTRAH